MANPCPAMKSTLAVDAAQVCSRANRTRYAEGHGLNPRGADTGAEAAIRNLQPCRELIWIGCLDDHARCNMCRVAMRQCHQWVACISTAPAKTLCWPNATVPKSAASIARHRRLRALDRAGAATRRRAHRALLASTRSEESPVGFFLGKPSVLLVAWRTLRATLIGFSVGMRSERTSAGPARSSGLRQMQPDLIAAHEPGCERPVVACGHGLARPRQVGSAQGRLQAGQVFVVVRL